MLATVVFQIASREARLTLTVGEKVVEQETWTYPHPISRTEAKTLAEAVFHDGYDLLQYAVHGDGDS